MAMKLKNGTGVKSATPISEGSDTFNVRLDDGTNMDMHRDIVDANFHGRGFFFTKLPFETEYDRKQKKAMQVSES